MCIRDSRIGEYLRLEADARRHGHRSASAAKAATGARGGAGAAPSAASLTPALTAHEVAALRAKMSKHRELIRRIFYHYRALDGLEAGAPAGGRLPPNLGGPVSGELHGLPPLLPHDDTTFVAKDGGYAHRQGEARDPDSARISLAQVWRLLREVRVLGAGLTCAECDNLWAEAGLLDNAEQRERERLEAGAAAAADDDDLSLIHI